METRPTYTTRGRVTDLIVGLPELAVLAVLVFSLPLTAMVAAVLAALGLPDGAAFAFAAPVGIPAGLVLAAHIADG